MALIVIALCIGAGYAMHIRQTRGQPFGRVFPLVTLADWQKELGEKSV